MAAEASAGSVEDQQQVQSMLETTDMTITEADVEEYNTAVADVEKYAQEAAGFLAASWIHGLQTRQTSGRHRTM